MLPPFNNVSLLNAADIQRDFSGSVLTLHAGTSRGSHFTFDFYIPSQVNWPPEMWNFVKWDAPGEVKMPTCNLALWCLSAERCNASDGKKNQREPRGNGLIRASGCMEICVCLCVSLSVRHCMCVFVSVFVCACLRGTVCSGTGGLSGWICQKPGAVLCTIRIKVAISGCYLLRDVLCSQFWWPLLSSPLTKAEMACVAAEYLRWDLFSLTDQLL